MQELETIMEEIGVKIAGSMGRKREGFLEAQDIIRKHMNNGWISVEDRLPEVGQYVIGTNQYDEVLVYHYGWNSPHTRKMFFHLCGSAADVTAWMPLPEPYHPEINGGNKRRMNNIRKIIGIKVINCPVCRHLIYPGDSYCYNCGHFINPEMAYVYEYEGAKNETRRSD